MATKNFFAIKHVSNVLTLFRADDFRKTSRYLVAYINLSK